MTLRPLLIDQIGTTPREIVLQPDVAARAALATRMGVPEIPQLHCTMRLSRDRSGRVIAAGTLTGRIVQEDVTTLEPFEATLDERFTLRFVPDEELSDRLDPDDPIDEVGITAGLLDLEEAMAQQLALALDPYPHAADRSIAS